jgi:2'-5' RNA ligase
VAFLRLAGARDSLPGATLCLDLLSYGIIDRMKTQGNRRAGYTHFVGVVVPEDIADVVESCRRWMADRYGCKSGYGTAPHITLVAPFAFEDERGVGVLEGAIAAWVADQRAFECTLSGFGAFAERTIFAHVEESAEWTRWHAGLVRAIGGIYPGLLPPDRRAFMPHLSVANRDIPFGAVPEALQHFSELDFNEKFMVDHAALFEWGNGAWTVRDQFPCAGK